MPNRRRSERRSTTYYFKVFDRSDDRLLGHAVDITTEGIMLTSIYKIRAKASFSLMLDLPFVIEGFKGEGHKIEFEAKSVWCDLDKNTGLYDTGFKFEEISKKSIGKIKAMIGNYAFASIEEA